MNEKVKNSVNAKQRVEYVGASRVVREEIFLSRESVLTKPLFEGPVLK